MAWVDLRIKAFLAESMTSVMQTLRELFSSAGPYDDALRSLFVASYC
jgi:hypothetical protein